MTPERTAEIQTETTRIELQEDILKRDEDVYTALVKKMSRVRLEITAQKKESKLNTSLPRLLEDQQAETARISRKLQSQGDRLKMLWKDEILSDPPAPEDDIVSGIDFDPVQVARHYFAGWKAVVMAKHGL